MERLQNEKEEWGGIPKYDVMLSIGHNKGTATKLAFTFRNRGFDIARESESVIISSYDGNASRIYFKFLDEADGHYKLAAPGEEDQNGRRIIFPFASESERISAIGWVGEYPIRYDGKANVFYIEKREKSPLK